MGKGRACRGLVSGEIVRKKKKRKGSLHSGSTLQSIHRKTSNPLEYLLEIFHGKICRVPRTVSAKSRREPAGYDGVVRNARRIANRKYRREATPSPFHPLVVLRLRITRAEKKEIGEMKLFHAPATVRLAPRISLASRRRVLNIQNFPRGTNFRILLGGCVSAGGLWLGFFHDLWFAAAVRRGNFPAEDSPIFQGIRNPWRNNATNVPFVKATVLAWK